MLKFLRKLLTGAGIGFLVGNVPGAILGAILAGAVSGSDNLLKTNVAQDRAKMIFISNLTILLTLVAKADDTISPREARTIADFFKKQLHFGEKELEMVRRIMKETVHQNPSPFAVAREFASVSHIEERLTLLRILWMVAEADSPAKDCEKQVIHTISRGLGIDERNYRSTHSEFSGNAADNYKVLGLTSDASPEEIKTAYRTMAKQYHPDRVSHLGEDFIRIANEKFTNINRAYNEIKEERGL